MSEYKTSMRRYSQYTLFLLAIFILCWGFTSYQAFFLSLIAGTVLSYYNLWSMLRKVNQLGDAAVKGKAMRSIGTFSRLATAALAVLIATKYPQYFQIIGLVIGLMSAYIIIIIDFLIQKIRA